ncbi:hypothetical protein BDW22DRAFT_1406597 [Trametopsis cervina]|nr:hypothetical protein BDW22DRAFT_1406597 [Trametopsis cervina]
MSLLQDVLRTQTLESLDKTLAGTHISREDNADSEDELVSVVSVPGTPARSRPASRPTSRATSPTRSNQRTARGALHLSALSSRTQKDPLRVLPTDVSQRIFGHLSIKQLAQCARVSRRWSKSQTLNYVWFQHYRKENFHDDTLPPGKWSKRESKQNWRTTYLSSVSTRSPITYSRPLSPAPSSGYQTPREMREEKWKADADAAQKPNKVEMRGMYKELGGRKAKAKTKVGASGTRDKTGWVDSFDDY